jgi:hypothetical protein
MTEEANVGNIVSDLLTEIEKWRKNARKELEVLSEKLQYALDVVLNEAVTHEDNFSSKLRILRQSAGTSLHELEHLASFDGDTFHQWLSGENLPSPTLQESIIRHCITVIKDARIDVSALEYITGVIGASHTRITRIASSMPKEHSITTAGADESPQPVQIPVTQVDPSELLFDPWMKIVDFGYPSPETNPFDLSVRVRNCLLNANLTYLGRLIQMKKQQMTAMPNFGRSSLVELTAIVESLGARFGMLAKDYPTLQKFNEEWKTLQETEKM